MFIGPLGTNFSENSTEFLTFSLTKMRLKVSSAKWWPLCLGLNVSNCFSQYDESVYGIVITCVGKPIKPTVILDQQLSVEPYFDLADERHRSLTGRKLYHYIDVIMSVMASQLTGVSVVYSTVCSPAGQRKTSKVRVIGLCEGNSPVTGEFPAQRASNAEGVSIWWRHHDHSSCGDWWGDVQYHEAGHYLQHPYLVNCMWFTKKKFPGRPSTKPILHHHHTPTILLIHFIFIHKMMLGHSDRLRYIRKLHVFNLTPERQTSVYLLNYNPCKRDRNVVNIS